MEHDHKLSSTIKFGAVFPQFFKETHLFHATQRHLPGGGRTLDQRGKMGLEDLATVRWWKMGGSLVFPEFYIYIYTYHHWYIPCIESSITLVILVNFQPILQVQPLRNRDLQAAEAAAEGTPRWTNRPPPAWPRLHRWRPGRLDLVDQGKLGEIYGLR